MNQAILTVLDPFSDMDDPDYILPTSMVGEKWLWQHYSKVVVPVARSASPLMIIFTPKLVTVTHAKKGRGAHTEFQLLLKVGTSPNLPARPLYTNAFRRAGAPVDYHFCPVCATTIKWGIEATPTRQIFAGGAFDNLGDIPMDGEMYTVSALPWSRLGCEVSRADEPDDEYRAALIKFSQSHR